MAEQATPTRQTHSERGDGELAELKAELAHAREEVLRLRDLLIGKDAELGSLRGRVAELEAGTARLLNLRAHLRARLPSFVLSALARLRGRRGPQG